MAESLHERYLGKYERGSVAPSCCSQCGQRLPQQEFDRLPIPNGGRTGGWTRDAILIALEEMQPQTREMINAAVGVSTAGVHLPYLCMDGRVVWQHGLGRRRWYAVSESAFTAAWRSSLATQEMKKAEQEKNVWRRARKMLRAVRSQLREASL